PGHDQVTSRGQVPQVTAAEPAVGGEGSLVRGQVEIAVELVGSSRQNLSWLAGGWLAGVGGHDLKCSAAQQPAVRARPQRQVLPWVPGGNSRMLRRPEQPVGRDAELAGPL